MKLLALLALTLSASAQPRLEIVRTGPLTYLLATQQLPRHKVYFEAASQPDGEWIRFAQWTLCDDAGGWIFQTVFISDFSAQKFFRTSQVPCQ